MASIIRGTIDRRDPGGPTVRGVAFDFEDMTNRADQYVQQVRDEAARIVQAAEAEAAQVRSNAERVGREAAEQAIEQVLAQRVGKQIDTLRPAVEGIVAQLTATRGEWLDHWQAAAVTLAVKIAERLIHRELPQHPQIAQEWLREALSLAAGSGEITVRLNPGDEKHLAPKAEEIARSMGDLAAAKIVADERVSLGGCIVETRYGAVDMRLESQLERIAEELS